MLGDDFLYIRDRRQVHVGVYFQHFVRQTFKRRPNTVGNVVFKPVGGKNLTIQGLKCTVHSKSPQKVSVVPGKRAKRRCPQGLHR